AQNDASLYHAHDLTKDSVFTSGIEGPAVDKNGNLYVVNFEKEGTIGIIAPNQPPQLFLTLPEGSVGNGIRFNQAGDMLIADYTRHNIIKIGMLDKSISVFAHDSTINQPNDIAITASGIIFASDPNWKDSTGKIWRIDQQGKVALLEKNM